MYDVYKELLALGFKEELIGTKMIAECLQLMHENKCAIYTGTMYSTLAERYGKTYNAVERNIRYAIKVWRTKEGVEHMRNTQALFRLYDRTYGGEIRPCALQRQVK